MTKHLSALAAFATVMFIYWCGGGGFERNFYLAIFVTVGVFVSIGVWGHLQDFEERKRKRR